MAVEMVRRGQILTLPHDSLEDGMWGFRGRGKDRC